MSKHNRLGQRTWLFKSISFVKTFTAWFACFCCVHSAYAETVKEVGYKQTERWASAVKREGQAVYGINSPTPMFLGQIHQESSGREWVTASDGGMGLGQFMPGTVTQVTNMFPELGASDPYNPVWSIRALVRYDGWIRKIVQGDDECQRFAAALKGYNAGPGYVQQSQKKSTHPGVWFGNVEYVPNKQSKENFEYSRTYPRKILFKHQQMFLRYGTPLCLPNTFPESSRSPVM